MCGVRTFLDSEQVEIWRKSRKIITSNSKIFHNFLQIHSNIIIIMYSPATKIIKCDVQTEVEFKWDDFVDGGNGCFYGIPLYARRVVEFTVEDCSIREIGPDLGDEGGKYLNGIKADNGSIYCMPLHAHYLLKIIPGEGQNTEVQILQEQIPEGDWIAGALSNDGFIYYFRYYNHNVRHIGSILKLDPSNGDSLSLVEESNFEEKPFGATIVGNDGFIYVILHRRVIKFSLTDYILSYTGKSFEHDNHHWKGAVLTDDGNIYAENLYGRILRIEMAQNNWKIIGNLMYNDLGLSWGNPVIGADKCIYFPPLCHDRVLRYNPSTQNVSFIGESYRGNWKWRSAVLASDGYIYCIPYFAKEILQIDSRHVNEQVIGMIENLNGTESIKD